ncbi:hypothetical protein FQZ97_1059940 [compost metagenome]
MSPTQRYQQALGGRITEHRHIGAQRLPERSFERVRILGQCRAGRLRGCQKLFTLSAIARLCGEVGLHVCLLLIF